MLLSCLKGADGEGQSPRQPPPNSGGWVPATHEIRTPLQYRFQSRRHAYDLRSQLPFLHKPRTDHSLHNSSHARTRGRALMEPNHVLHPHTMLRNCTRQSAGRLVSSGLTHRGVVSTSPHSWHGTESSTRGGLGTISGWRVSSITVSLSQNKCPNLVRPTPHFSHLSPFL